ncbi:MAG: GNAT family N-acetyltransferase [Deltaproteobacteria bacterium]|nr:GNAT family N-acetyltransferase [Deltaproteobacteria bacterium]
MTINIKHVEGTSDLDAVRILFQEYADSLAFDLSFQDFEKELESLPGRYAFPEGCLLIAQNQDGIVGCVAARKIDNGVCEMKRLFVRPEYRGTGIGRRLAMESIQTAIRLGYSHMRLDTTPSMSTATSLYRSLGFCDTEPYCYNPVPGAVYLELNLDAFAYN